MGSQNGTHKCKFKRTSRENYSSALQAVYYLFCCPFIHCYLSMEGNYCLKFDQHSTITYIVTNPRTIILVENWRPSCGDGTGGPTETMTGHSRSTLDMGFAEFVPGSNSTNRTLLQILANPTKNPRSSYAILSQLRLPKVVQNDRYWFRQKLLKWGC